MAQLMEKQRVARAAAATKNGLECACGAGVGGEHTKQCTHYPLRRLTMTKLPQQHHHPQHHHHHHHQVTTPHHHHDSSNNTVTSSRQALVALPAPSDADSSNQVRVYFALFQRVIFRTFLQTEKFVKTLYSFMFYK